MCISHFLSLWPDHLPFCWSSDATPLPTSRDPRSEKFLPLFRKKKKKTKNDTSCVQKDCATSQCQIWPIIVENTFSCPLRRSEHNTYLPWKLEAAAASGESVADIQMERAFNCIFEKYYLCILQDNFRFYPPPPRQSVKQEQTVLEMWRHTFVNPQAEHCFPLSLTTILTPSRTSGVYGHAFKPNHLGNTSAAMATCFLIFVICKQLTTPAAAD